MKKRFIIFVCLIAMVAAVYSYSFSFNYEAKTYVASDPITVEKMKHLPVPADFRNYFLLQSIDDTTSIVIGDFVSTDKKFCLIIDNKSDSKIEKIVEYMPDIHKYTNLTKPSTPFFTTYEDVKERILNGDMFMNNYSYSMYSINILKELIKRGQDIMKYNYGYTVRLYDPDQPSTIMSEFYFNKNLEGRYDLVFKTMYYKVYRTKIVPAVNCSVYCRNSKDPAIARVVEELLQMVPQGIVTPE